MTNESLNFLKARIEKRISERNRCYVFIRTIDHEMYALNTEQARVFAQSDSDIICVPRDSDEIILATEYIVSAKLS